MYKYDEIIKVANARGIFSDFSTPENVGYLLCEWARLGRCIEANMMTRAHQSIGVQYFILMRLMHHNAVPTIEEIHNPAAQYNPLTILSEEYLLLGLHPTAGCHYIWAVGSLRTVASQHGTTLEACVDAVLAEYMEPW